MPEGDYNYNSGSAFLRWQADPDLPGLLVEDLWWAVFPPPTRHLMSGGQIFIESGRAPSPRMRFGKLLGPTVLMNEFMRVHGSVFNGEHEFMRVHGSVFNDEHDFTLELRHSGPGPLVRSEFLTAENAIIELVDLSTAAGDITVAREVSLIVSALYIE